MTSPSRFWLGLLLLTEAPLLFAQTDLSVTVSDAPDPLQAGANLTYTINVQNLGPNAGNVTLSNPVPANTTFVSFSAPAGWSVSTPPVHATGTVTANLASLSAADGVGSDPSRLTAVGSTVFFTADSGSGRELWMSDGTTAGTVLVKDINPAGDSVPFSSPLIDVNGTVFFTADDGVTGRELWKSDGTPAGTALVKNIHPDTDSFPSDFASVNGTLFFTADDGVNGEELWKSDGTAAGTVPVKVISPGTSPSYGPFNLVGVGSTLFFALWNSSAGNYQLWKSDGSGAGTVPLKDFIPLNNQSVPPACLTAFNGALLFFGWDNVHGYELWKSDGTPEGTVHVKDINPGAAGSYVNNTSTMLDANGTLYLVAKHVDYGFELWKSDGTAAGTAPVKDINPGTAHSLARSLTNVNGTLFFSATNGLSGEELWKSNGTAAGTVVVADLHPGTASTLVQLLRAVNGTLFFNANDSAHGQELWKSDGTAAGTVLVKDIAPGASGNGSPWSGFPTMLTEVNGRLIFRAGDGSSGQELWTSDGTTAGTVRVRNLNAPSAVFTLVVQVNPGTPSGTTLTNTATISSAMSDPLSANNSAIATTSVVTPTADLSVTLTDSIDPVVAGNQMTYTITLTNAGPTPAANVVLTDVVPAGTTFFTFTAPAGWTSSTPNLFEAGTVTSSIPTMPVGTAEFTLVVGVNSQPADNSTLSNTVSVTSLTGDPASGNNSDTEITLARTPRADLSITTIDSPDPVFPNQNVTYNITITNHGLEATRNGVNFTTSVPAGTTYVSGPTGGSGFNLPAGADLSSSPSSLLEFNGALFFSADDGPTGRELWKSDGTTAGTARLIDIHSGLEDGIPDLFPTSPFGQMTGFLYFRGVDAANGAELWKSNGTAAGTAILKNIRAGSESSFPTRFTRVGATVFFIANDGSGYELWKTDGSPGGTGRVKDIYPGPGSSVYSGPFLAVGDTLYFSADDDASGTELWKSDGTEAGTVPVKDIYPGPFHSNPENLTNVGDMVFFTANDGVNGPELWRSNGTEAGTVLVAAIHSGSANFPPHSLFNYQGTLLFSALDPALGDELWRSDGTAEGTALVRDISSAFSSSPIGFAELNGVAYFAARNDGNGRELWRTDGTEDGTRLVRDIRPGPASSDPSGLINLNGTLFFTADDGTNGVELWRSDGTENGTILVRNINPAGNSYPSELSNFNGILAFVADNGLNGSELWRSDGTAAGTVQVRNIQAVNAVTYSLVVKVNAGTPAGTVLSHTASVSTTTPPDPVAGNNSVTTTTTVVALNAQPTLSSIELAPLDYVEGVPPTPVSATLTPADANSFSLASATIAISGNYLSSEDVLGYAAVPGISGSFDPASGVLTLSGAASLARYQAALRAVSYRNTSYYPSSLHRTVRFQVNDGAAANNLSNVMTRAISITALDDTPRVISIEPETGAPGTSRLTFAGIAARAYTIEFNDTLDPSNWQPLATSDADAQGIFAILDTPPPGTARRFYRARFP